MGEHPQVPELRNRLNVLFAGDSPANYLQIYEPESGSSVEVIRDGETGRVALRFGLHEQDAEGLAAARRVKLPKPRLEQSRFFDGRIFKRYSFRCRVGGPDETIKRVLAALLEVQRLSGEEWLWITDEPEFDQWPYPLPKPERWPPGTLPEVGREPDVP